MSAEILNAERLENLKQIVTDAGYSVRATETREETGELPEIRLELRQRTFAAQESEKK